MREELNYSGFEIVYNATGVCEEAVVAKERKEAILVKIKFIVHKLENARSYNDPKKKEKIISAMTLITVLMVRLALLPIALKTQFQHLLLVLISIC